MRRKKYHEIECIALVVARGSIGNVEHIKEVEVKQEEYIRRYAKAHGIRIVGVVHGSGLGQYEINKKFNQIVELIRRGRVQGIIMVNMRMIACDMVDAYCKVGKVRSAGGEMITVDEGRLKLEIWRNK